MKNYLKILGSVSPFPTKRNNCPGYLFYINNQKILLDCGPGVTAGLNIPDDLNGLSIFISHYHKDHYSDLFSIGYASYVYNKLGILKEKINLYIPKVDSNCSEIYDYYLLKNFKEHYFNIIEYDENDEFKFNDITVNFMKNYHSIESYSTKINYNEKKFVYTSDLGYNTKEKLIGFSKNADYLLIECSFLVNEKHENEFHLSAYDSANIALEAQVGTLLLTHFWPKHSKRKYLKEAKKFFNNTKVVRENKIISI